MNRQALQIPILTPIRNGRLVSGPACPRCERTWKYFQRVDADGHAVGRPRPLGPHCTTCCSNGHWACAVCGRCLPKYRGRAGAGQTRIDRRTCSDACRQRAYRHRITAKKGVAVTLAPATAASGSANAKGLHL
jgi:hypothetical protein